MDSSLQASSNSKLYGIEEYSIPKVSSDGEPHEMMTMIAAGSGLIAAVIVLAILIMVIGCGNPDRRNEQQASSTSASSSSSTSNENLQNTDDVVNKTTIIPIFQTHKNFEDSDVINLASVSTISTLINKQGYDNPGCEDQAQIKDELILRAIALPEIKTIHC